MGIVISGGQAPWDASISVVYSLGQQVSGQFADFVATKNGNDFLIGN